MADKMGVDKFVTPDDISEGSENLNFAFIADMFSKYPGIRYIHLFSFFLTHISSVPKSLNYRRPKDKRPKMTCKGPNWIREGIAYYSCITNFVFRREEDLRYHELESMRQSTEHGKDKFNEKETTETEKEKEKEKETETEKETEHKKTSFPGLFERISKRTPSTVPLILLVLFIAVIAVIAFKALSPEQRLLPRDTPSTLLSRRKYGACTLEYVHFYPPKHEVCPLLENLHLPEGHYDDWNFEKYNWRKPK